jgi:hypothetical protein
MATITSLTNPDLFQNAQVLPSGFIYVLSQTSNTYAFGIKQPLYQISIVRQSDSATVNGTPFYPSDAYPDAQTMITDECDNVYGPWQTAFNQDAMTTAAKALIGF